jgi:epoxyqueuosine reductase
MKTDNYLKKILIDKASEIGFDKIRFAKAENLDFETANLRTWLDSYFNAGMEYFYRGFEKRRNPGLILENAKTIIVTAINYYYPLEESDKPTTGEEFRISRYSLARDYHKVILKRLKALSLTIKKYIPIAHTKEYADTGPVMEKQWAVRAGIGWQGKNGIIITPEFGSWVFLGVILTDLEIEPDQPIPNKCGDCTQCIDACPTGAIIQPSVIDAQKCLAYLTLDTPDPLPPEIARQNPGWVYGCDSCQEACPWNSKAKTTNCIEFIPTIRQKISLDDIMNMTESEFEERFKGTCMKKLTLQGLKNKTERNSEL